MKWHKKMRKYGKMILRDKNIRLVKVKYKGKKANAQDDWPAIRNPVRMLWTAFVFEILRKTPPCRIKNFIYRMFGVKIGKGVSIAYNVLPDPLYPELLTIEDGVLIGSDCELACHEFTNNLVTLGRTVIKKNAMIAAYVVVRVGITIGENAIVGMKSYVNKDIGKNEFWGGIPAKFIKKINPKDLIPKKDVEIIRYETKKTD